MHFSHAAHLHKRTGSSSLVWLSGNNKLRDQIMNEVMRLQKGSAGGKWPETLAEIMNLIGSRWPCGAIACAMPTTLRNWSGAITTSL